MHGSEMCSPGNVTPAWMLSKHSLLFPGTYDDGVTAVPLQQHTCCQNPEDADRSSALPSQMGTPGTFPPAEEGDVTQPSAVLLAQGDLRAVPVT